MAVAFKWAWNVGNSPLLQPLYAVRRITVTVHVRGPPQIANNFKYQHHCTRYDMENSLLLQPLYAVHRITVTVHVWSSPACQ